MTQLNDMHTRLGIRLTELFHLPAVDEVSLMHGGVLCENYLVRAGDKRYFLKQYRKQTSTWVYEIKFAEQFFAENDIPVILPLGDRHGRTAFWFEDNWYSLFPFVEGGIQKDADALTEADARALGTMLARMHRAGVRSAGRELPQLKLWDRGRFLFEYADVRSALEAHGGSDEIDTLARQTLDRKHAFVLSNNLYPQDFDLPRNCLLHGDFHFGNVFFSPGGEVAQVFDLEKACMGPRAFELSRAILISCFDTGFQEMHFTRGQAFLSAYRETFPIGFDEFLRGFRAYGIDLAHTLWMEAKRYLRGSTHYDRIYRFHAQRVAYLLEGDRREFARRLWGSAGGMESPR